MRKICADIFKDTYDKCENILYLKQSIQQSIKLTKLYVEGYKNNINNTSIKSKEYNIVITPDRTLEAVNKNYISKINKSKIGVLDFTLNIQVEEFGVALDHKKNLYVMLQLYFPVLTLII